jgi:predicted membrane-bound dolichyl-phosphate-mannose-protein mannosyltransferase
VPAAFAAFLTMHQEIQDANTHSQLQDDLVEHLWMLKENTLVLLLVFYLFGFQTMYHFYVRTML